VRVFKFIPPCLPLLKPEPPRGKGWLHEVKFDGWRVQLHKNGDQVRIYSKSGHNFAGRFPEIEAALLFFLGRAAIVDAELTACDTDGLPDFGALLRNDADCLCVWAFDLLAINDKDLRQLPLHERKARLQRLVQKYGDDRVRYSDAFDDPDILLDACTRMKLEGIVSKRADSPYRSGNSKDWIKVKCTEWKEMNAWRHEYFEKRR
jgi:bifunctional non-homologous end joining protein LigD